MYFLSLHNINSTPVLFSSRPIHFFIAIIITALSLPSFATPPMIPFGLKGLIISPDNKRLVYYRNHPNSSDSTFSIRNINLHNGKTLNLTTVEKTGTENLEPYGLMPDADKLLLLNNRGVEVIHNKTGKILRTLPLPRKGFLQANEPGYPPLKATLSQHGNLLALADWSNKTPTIYLVNTGSKKILHRIPMPLQEPRHGMGFRHVMAFSPDGRVLSWLTQGLGGNREQPKFYLYRYSFYQKKALEPIQLSINPLSLITGIRYSPNGQYALIIGLDSVNLVDLKSGELKLVHSENRGFSYAGFTQDQKHLLLVSSIDNKIIIRDISSGQETSTVIPLEQNEIFDGPFIQSKDLKYLAGGIQSAQSVYKKDRVLLFDTQNGRLVRRFDFAVENEKVVVPPRLNRKSSGFSQRQ